MPKRQTKKIEIEVPSGGKVQITIEGPKPVKGKKKKESSGRRRLLG